MKKITVSDINTCIWGESPLSFYFSFDGIFNRLQFFGSIATLNIILNIINAAGIYILTMFGYALCLYAMLAAAQKRMHDMNRQGSALILLLSVSCILTGATAQLHFLGEVDLAENIYLKNIFGISFLVYLVLQAFLLFMPGAEKKEMTKRSPLLKNPPLYFLICVIIYAIVAYFIRDL